MSPPPEFHGRRPPEPPHGVERRAAKAAPAVDHRLEAEADRFAGTLADRRTAGAAGPVRPMPPLPVPAPPPPGSAGAPLDAQTRSEMESRLGWDLTHVRVHTGRRAAEAADALGARAYTTGPHIVCGGGEDPASASGRRLIAHELAHVAQQARGEGHGTVHLKPQAPPKPKTPASRLFPLKVTRVMSPPELLREFVRQYYQATSEQEVDRRLGWWHWETGRGRSATADDVRRGVLQLRVTDVTRTAMERLAPAEQAQVNEEADVRFWRESGLAPGTKLGTGPEDAALRARWLGARADVLQEHEQRREIAALPEDIRRVLFGGTRPLAPEEYETVLRIARKLGALDPAQRADYLGRVNAGTNDWAELDASIDRFIVQERARENEARRTREAEATLFGCEDLYELWARRNRLRMAAAFATGPYPGVSAGTSSALQEAGARFQEALARHGFADEAAFLAAMETYRLRFRSEAVQLALDVLARYDHLLYEERLRLNSPGYTEKMVAGIAATQASAQYAAAAEQESVARLIEMTADPESMRERLRAHQEAAPHREKAASLRGSAAAAVVTASGDDPLVDPEQLGRATDREKLTRLDAPAARQYLLDVAAERLADTGRARREFTDDPERVFSLPQLIEVTRRTQGVDQGTIYDWIVRDHLEAVRDRHLFSAVVLGIIALVLAALVPGGGWLAAAALVANTAISGYQAIEAIEEYGRQAVEYRLAFLAEEPSLFWVGVAVAAAAVDLGMTTGALLKMSAKGLTALEGPLREFSAATDIETATTRYQALSARIRTVEGLTPEVRAAIEEAGAAKLAFETAAGQAMSKLGSLPIFNPDWYKAVYYGLKTGVKTLARFRKEPRLYALMGDVTQLSTATRAELETAFGQLQKIVTTADRTGMDDATALRYVERLADEREAGQGAFEALMADMRAWRPPTAQQIEAEAKLGRASEILADLHQERAGLLAERAARPKTPSGAVDTERIGEIDARLKELEDEVVRSGPNAGRVRREGELTRARHNLEKAEELAEAARVRPTVRMRQYFNASREKAAVALAKTDQVGPLLRSSSALEVDHVVSIQRISEMPGFEKLRPNELRTLAVRQDNLVRMDAFANASKGDRSWRTWKQAGFYYGPDVVEKWAAKDAELTKTIQDWIQATVRGR
ncbi:eCIS core domain-containing protein [Streptomyces sp. NPDC055815]